MINTVLTHRSPNMQVMLFSFLNTEFGQNVFQLGFVTGTRAQRSVTHTYTLGWKSVSVEL